MGEREGKREGQQQSSAESRCSRQHLGAIREPVGKTLHSAETLGSPSQRRLRPRLLHVQEEEVEVLQRRTPPAPPPIHPSGEETKHSNTTNVINSYLDTEVRRSRLIKVTIRGGV